jgi:L-rhamnose mutarotase
MYTTGMTFKLKPGCYAEYKKAHDELWPGIAAQVKGEGVHMIIYEYEDRLFLHAEAPSKEHFERGQLGEETARWHAYMAKLMATDSAGESIVEDLEVAFVFGRYANE